MVLHAVHCIAFGNEAWILLNIMMHDSALNRDLQVFRLENTFNALVSGAMLVSSSCVRLAWCGAAAGTVLVGVAKEIGVRPPDRRH